MAGSSYLDYRNVYEVDKILDEKLVNGIIHYKIHWKGYGDDEDTWEPESSLLRCESLIKEYRSSKSSTQQNPPRVSSDEEPVVTPSRQARSLTRRNVSSPRSSRRTPTRDYSPGRYNLRRTPQRMSYLTTEEGGPSKSPLGHGFERRNLHDDDPTKPVDAEETPVVATPTEGEEQTDNGSKPPSWMELGYAELFFCLCILLVIVVAIWYLSNAKITNPFP